MNQTLEGLDSLTLNITEEIHVNAPLDVTFRALLEEIGPHNRTPDGQALPMKIEPWPGGRWYRDLGGEDGHFWGHVQAIKRYTLLEITGPLFMSGPATSNVQYRLSEVPGGTLIKFRHSALGFIDEELKPRIGTGWHSLHSRVQSRAEAGR